MPTTDTGSLQTQMFRYREDRNLNNSFTYSIPFLFTITVKYTLRKRLLVHPHKLIFLYKHHPWSIVSAGFVPKNQDRGLQERMKV